MAAPPWLQKFVDTGERRWYHAVGNPGFVDFIYQRAPHIVFKDSQNVEIHRNDNVTFPYEAPGMPVESTEQGKIFGLRTVNNNDNWQIAVIEAVNGNVFVGPPNLVTKVNNNQPAAVPMMLDGGLRRKRRHTKHRGKKRGKKSRKNRK